LYDALVIGGGPVGSYVAKGLALKGHRVGVLEKKPEGIRDICCTGLISKNCYETYLSDTNLIIRQAKSAKVYSPSGKILGLNHQKDQAVLIERAKLDSVMAIEAQKHGAEYFYNRNVKNVLKLNDRMRVEYQNGVYSDFTDARVVVYAGGFNSLQNKIKPKKQPNFTIGAQIEVYHQNIEEIEIHIGKHIAPGFFGWLVPIDDKKALVGLMAGHNPDKYLKDFLALLAERGKITINGSVPTYRGITLEPPAKTHSDRFVVVGDAAGHVKPLTGGGIFFGLLCADIAIQNIDEALVQNDLRASKLASYEKEWRQKLNKELQLCRFAQGLYSRLNDRQIDWLFEFGNTSGIVNKISSSSNLDFDFHSKVIRKTAAPSNILKLLFTKHPLS